MLHNRKHVQVKLTTLSLFVVPIEREDHAGAFRGPSSAVAVSSHRCVMCALLESSASPFFYLSPVACLPTDWWYTAEFCALSGFCLFRKSPTELLILTHITPSPLPQPASSTSTTCMAPWRHARLRASQPLKSTPCAASAMTSAPKR